MTIKIKGQDIEIRREAAMYVGSLGQGMYGEVVGAMSVLGMHNEALAWRTAKESLDALVAENPYQISAEPSKDFFNPYRPNEDRIQEQADHVDRLWKPTCRN